MVELLERVASYSVSNGFVNSTHALAPSTSSPNAPEAYAVRVNRLWFLSLTLSIITSFFAITIQQWLRHIIVPQHVPLRDAIRLREFRYEGLMRWKMPIILAVLPALIQISVIIFLVGLIDYAQHSNRDVSLPFTVVSSMSLALFIVASLLPNLDPSCPYKSPLVHIAWQILWFAGVVTTLLVIPPVVCLLSCSNLMCYAPLSRIADWISKNPIKYVSYLQPSSADLSRFWTAKEMQIASSVSEADKFDRKALSWTLAAGPSIEEIRCCLAEFHPHARTRCVLEWISVKVNGRPKVSRLLGSGTVGKKALDKVDLAFAKDFADLLMDVLSQDWPTAQDLEKADPSNRPLPRSGDPDVAHVVTFLWKMVKIGSEELHREQHLRAALLTELVVLCTELKLDLVASKSWRGWKAHPRVVPVLLFDIIAAEDRLTKLQDFRAQGELDMVVIYRGLTISRRRWHLRDGCKRDGVPDRQRTGRGRSCAVLDCTWRTCLLCYSGGALHAGRIPLARPRCRCAERSPWIASRSSRVCTQGCGPHEERGDQQHNNSGRL